jgi:hypothetical protein
MGEAKNGAKTLHFDGSIKLEFRGAKVTRDAGLLAVRELDEVLRLTDIAAEMLSEARANNRRHYLSGLFRQSVYVRLAGPAGADRRKIQGHGQEALLSGRRRLRLAGHL